MRLHTPHNSRLPLNPYPAVVLINVLGFYDPLRTLIQTAIIEGFIEPQNECLVLFVDGPPGPLYADNEEWKRAHEEFDWGMAALEAGG